MENKKLDNIIEQELKCFSISTDMEMSVMKAVMAIDRKRQKRFYLLKILLSAMALLVNVAAIFSFQKNMEMFQLILSFLPTLAIFIQVLFYGFFFLMSLALLGSIIWLLKSKEREESAV